MAAVKDLTASLTHLTSELSKIPPSDSGLSTPEDRKELLAAAKGLVATLEGPEVATWRVVYGVSISPITTWSIPGEENRQRNGRYLNERKRRGREEDWRNG